MIKFNDLSMPLKVLVIYGWINFALSAGIFIIAILDGLRAAVNMR